jgi:hypothetical protein
MKTTSKSSVRSRTAVAGTPDVLAPFSFFTTLLTVYKDADMAQLRARWVDTLPAAGIGDWVVVLSADPASQPQQQAPGLYAQYLGAWTLAAPYDAICDYTARGLEFDVYLDVASVKTVPAGADVYHDGVSQPGTTTIPQGKGVYAAVTLDDVARKRNAEVDGANPTAKLGLTAVNGTSTSFMRADAAPALDQSIAPSWSGSHTFSGASPTIANDQTVTAYEPSPKQLITRAYAEAKFKSGGATGANPTAEVKLEPQNGSSTSFMRSDAAPALNQAISPVWSQPHYFSFPKEIAVTLADLPFSPGSSTRTDLNRPGTPYVGIGGWEYVKGSYNVIGYGFSPGYPVLVGSQVVDAEEFTTAAFVVATRNGTALIDKIEVRFQVTPDGRAQITNDQTAPGYTPDKQELITSAYAEKNFKGGGATGANPTAEVKLEPQNGSSTSFMRADAAPALSQAITPTWTGKHTFEAVGQQMIKLADSPGSDTDAKRTDLSALNTPYMGVGGGEWKNGAYYLIGYGYNKGAASYPVLAGAVEETSSGNTTASFVVATRSGGSDTTPTWKFKVKPDGRAEIGNDQTAPGYTPESQELITRAYAEKNFKGGGATGANPTAEVKLEPQNGSSTSFMRSDAAPALSQAITPTWTGKHIFNAVGKRMIQLADKLTGDSPRTTRTSLTDVDTPYMGIGGQESGLGYCLIGYGYNDDNKSSYPVLVGSLGAYNSGDTSASFVVATRNGIHPDGPTQVRFLITPEGRPQITTDQAAEGYYPNPNELITRAYAEKNFKGGGATGLIKVGPEQHVNTIDKVVDGAVYVALWNDTLVTDGFTLNWEVPLTSLGFVGASFKIINISRAKVTLKNIDVGKYPRQYVPFYYRGYTPVDIALEPGEGWLFIQTDDAGAIHVIGNDYGRN